MKYIPLATALLVGLSTIIFLLTGEIMLHLIKPVQIVGLSHQPLIYKMNENNGYSYVANAEGWIHRNFEMDNLVRINSKGFHDTERNNQKGFDTIRIASIGDSFTSAIHVPTSDTWTQILERELNKSIDSQVEIVNLGLDGTGTDVHLNILSSYLKTNKIDAAILAFYVNDIADMKLHRVYREIYDGYIISYQNTRQKNIVLEYIRTNKPLDVVRILYKRSYLFRAFMYLIKKQSLLNSNFIGFKDAGINELLKYSEEEQESRIKLTFTRLLELSKENNFVLYVVPVPDKSGSNRSLNTFTKKVTKKFNAPLNIVDVMPTLNNILMDQQLDFNQLFWEYDSHFNIKGNLFFGLSVADALRHRISPLSYTVDN